MENMKIDYLPLKRITAMHGVEISEAVQQVVDSGWYLQGKAVQGFESEYARYIGSCHCVSCGNGLDALSLIFRSYIELGRLNEGDEVIVPANTYIASILSITENRLTPVLVEPDMNTLQIDDRLIEAAITPRTRAILVVHLYGQCAYTDYMGELCRKYGLLLVEDNAQAHGCRFGNHRTGSLGNAAAHSFYPGKNLGALGDAGAVTTDDELLAQTVRTIANYGSSRKYVFPYRGRNSRMDEIQAAVLSVKLKYLDADNNRRRKIAGAYREKIAQPLVCLPRFNGNDNVYHIFPILAERRDELQAALREDGVQTIIHYPIPPHRQEAYREWNGRSLPLTEQIHRQELSLPCHQAMTEEEISYVAEAVNRVVL
ncbi:DegT/DnrJ/EryC1/StrS family aminotransferase [Prevotella dentasini]